MKKALFIFGLFIPFSVLCQNSAKVIPGYLGKKWVFDYTLNVMPSFITENPGANTDYNEYNEEGRKFYFNTQHKISVERVVGRKFSVVGTLLLSKNQARVERSSRTFDEFLQINTRGYIFTLRHYRKHLAPISKYFDYKIGYYSITPEDLDYNYRDLEIDSVYTRTVNAGSVGDFYMGFGWGNSRVIKDRVIFSFGFEFGLLFGGMLDAANLGDESRSIDTESPNSVTSHNTVHAIARERVFLESLMNFTVRIGFMP